jgi:C-terminal processing protease CtpA/Prc
MPLYEPKDVAIKDYSKLSYSAAFQNMFDFLKNEYAFNGIKGKEPAWDSLYAAIMPRVKDAEQKKDAGAYFAALSDFSLGFKDGHVSINGGDAGQRVTAQRLANGYGFAIRELDDKRVIVVYVTRNGPAQAAGLAVGDEILSFNDTPIGQAIGDVSVLSPQSSDFALRYDQARYLLRAGAAGDTAKISYKNRSGATKNATLKAVAERQSFYFTSIFRNFDETALPVEYRILDSGSGYIKINSNYDDLNLIIRLFERGLKTFEANGVTSLIIDMRANSGGTPLGLAGYLTDQEIPLGTLEYFNTKSGKFEPDREADKFTPNENQYRFKKMALLVDQACFSACEIEAFGFSKVPGMIVVGMYPTGGVEAEVARGQFVLPEGMDAQFPTGRFVLEDGSLFLEGQGVRPTVLVPISADNVLSQEDVVLQTAEDRVK